MKEENIQFSFLGYIFKPRKAKGKASTVFTSIKQRVQRGHTSGGKKMALIVDDQSIDYGYCPKVYSIIRGCLTTTGITGRKNWPEYCNTLTYT